MKVEITIVQYSNPIVSVSNPINQPLGVAERGRGVAEVGGESVEVWHVRACHKALVGALDPKKPQSSLRQQGKFTKQK